jgi:hypothetical protein
VNPMIALGARAPQFDAPDPNAESNRMLRMLQMGEALDTAQMNRLKADEYKRGVARTNRLEQVLAGGGGVKELRQGGFLKESLEVDKAERESQAQAALAAERRQNVAKAGYGEFRKTLAGHYNNPNLTPDAVLGDVQRLVHAGIMDEGVASKLVATLPQDPQQLRGHLFNVVNAELPPEKMLEIFAPKPTEVSNGQQKFFRDTNPRSPTYGQNTAGAPVQMQMSPGEVAADARARAQLAQSERHFQTTQANTTRGQFIETPTGYMLADPKTGAVRPVTGPDGQPLKGKAADRQLTDSQAKANLFGSRMKESDRILSELEGKYNPMAVNAKMGAAEVPLVGGVAGYAGNLMLTEKGQQAEQAQRDFINAVLRRESGAVITPQEFANGQKQYFPQPGDTPAVLAQKARNRKLAIHGMEAEVPGGFRGGPQLTNPTGNAGGATGDFSPQPADVDALVKKYGGR